MSRAEEWTDFACCKNTGMVSFGQHLHLLTQMGLSNAVAKQTRVCRQNNMELTLPLQRSKSAQRKPIKTKTINPVVF